MVTESTRMPFGKYRGKRLKDCPDNYLNWVASNLLETDLYEFAVAAKKLYESREKEDVVSHILEEAADKFLEEHGVNPKKL